MENKLRFPLDLQLFGEKGKTGDIDPDKALEEMGDAKEIDEDTDDDLYEDEDEDIEDDEVEDEEDEESDEDDEEDSDSDEDEDKSKEDKSKEDTKSNDDKTDEDKSKSDDTKKPQSRDVNKEQKALRLQREAEEKARKENFQKGFIAALGGKNPYTDEEIKTEDDIHEAQVMIEAKKRGLDPIQDYHKMDKILKSEEREALAKEAQKKVDEEKARQDDFNEFAEAYPEVKVEELFQDKDFEEFASDLVGNVPLKTIYAKFLKVKEKTASAAQDGKDMETARRKSTPGPTNSGSDTNGDFYTLEELKKMSPAEIEKNWVKVNKSYEHLSKAGKK